MNPVRLIIRDDDTNFFTRPDDLESVYSIIPSFPVSFAVVPYIVEAGEMCPETRGNSIPRCIADNIDLVQYLIEKFNNKGCDILLHGITHQYHYENGKKVSEMIWRELEEPNLLDKRIKDCKEKLEETFHADVNCFAAPHNDIGRIGIRAVYNAGMHYSGIIPLSFSRDLSYKSVRNYIKRFWIRYSKGFQYPGILNYGTHIEVNACVAGEGDYLYNIYRYSKCEGTPMAVNVHYWDMRDNPQKYTHFFKFILYALEDGAIPSRMRDIL